jgi:hypothetical protein
MNYFREIEAVFLIIKSSSFHPAASIARKKIIGGVFGYFI